MKPKTTKTNNNFSSAKSGIGAKAQRQSFCGSKFYVLNKLLSLQ